MPVTKFPTSADGVADRMSGFMAHLRMNGMPAGVAETEASLEAMQAVNMLDMSEARLALKVICANDAERFERFDELFEAYWLNDGRERQRPGKPDDKPHQKNRWSNQSVFENGMETSSSGTQDLPEEDDGKDASQSCDGKLIASKIKNANKADLREFIKPEDLAYAEKVAKRIAKTIRDRRSRRRKAARRGANLDLRKIARKSVSTGGEPIELFKRHKPDRPVHLVALLDVSGSMSVYARVFLAFLKGLISADQRTDAYLFHTQLVRISDALRDGDTFRSVNRLSMMAQGFGGGTKIGSNLELFNAQYASKTVNGNSVVVILSDGYDTDPPEKLEQALRRLKKRGCKIIWLNPLKGWKDYEPVAKGMSAALPHLDLFAAANTLDGLAALEPHLAKT
ncbi:MAG: VWA domain-containing protein [Rhizobiaceae bacterium]|nr:VWA domain-containing protein [Rhizobiaceae bacterium]